MSTRLRRIVLGVTGSIAATKSQSIALALQHSGFEVRVCLTHSAQQVIGKAALSSVLQEAPYIEMWTPPRGAGETHIEWAEWADAMLIAPATASVLSALWLGAYDSTVTLVAGNVAPASLFVAPAMSMEMWEQPAVKRNVRDLKKWGVRFLGPETGRVASGATGQRLMAPREIATQIDSLIKNTRTA